MNAVSDRSFLLTGFNRSILEKSVYMVFFSKSEIGSRDFFRFHQLTDWMTIFTFSGKKKLFSVSLNH